MGFYKIQAIIWAKFPLYVDDPDAGRQLSSSHTYMGEAIVNYDQLMYKICTSFIHNIIANIMILFINLETNEMYICPPPPPPPLFFLITWINFNHGIGK